MPRGRSQSNRMAAVDRTGKSLEAIEVLGRHGDTVGSAAEATDDPLFRDKEKFPAIVAPPKIAGLPMQSVAGCGNTG